jgi:hypothetical protein
MCGCTQGVPEFVTKGQLAQLHTSAMSRARNAEKVLLGEPILALLDTYSLPAALHAPSMEPFPNARRRSSSARPWSKRSARRASAWTALQQLLHLVSVTST